MAEKDKESEKKAAAPDEKTESEKKAAPDAKTEPEKKAAPDAKTDKGTGGKEQVEPVKAEAKSETSKPREPAPPLKKPSTGSAQPERKPVQDSPPPASQEQKKSGSGIVWLALLLALVASGGAGYTYWMFNQYKVADQTSTNDVEQRALQAIESQSKTITSGVEQQNRQIQEQDRIVRELEARLVATLRQVNEISHVSRRSWMLAEAEYLLRLANQRLIMEKEISSPLALLKAADEILLTVDDVNLYPVRAELAKEIEALKAIGRMDIEGVFLKLNALEQQVSNLALLSPEPGEKQAETETVKEQSDVLKTMDRAVSRLSDLVRIRHRDEPVEPLLSPEHHQYLQQNLRLMMEQAQLALLQQRASLYKQSLEKAEHWVHTYFQLNDSADGVLSSLAELKELNVAPELPDISASLAMLKKYLSNPDILLEQKGGNKPAGQASTRPPMNGGS